MPMSTQVVADLAEKAADDVTAAVLRTMNLLDPHDATAMLFVATKAAQPLLMLSATLANPELKNTRPTNLDAVADLITDDALLWCGLLIAKHASRMMRGQSFDETISAVDKQFHTLTGRWFTSSMDNCDCPACRQRREMKTAGGPSPAEPSTVN